MASALQWIIRRTLIAITTHTTATPAPEGGRTTTTTTTRRPSLLELYCGYGAHTIPLALSGVFRSIVAIELDGRLVGGCRRNFGLNGLRPTTTTTTTADTDGGGGEGTESADPPKATTRVEVVQGDAGRLCQRVERRRYDNPPTTTTATPPPTNTVTVTTTSKNNNDDDDWTTRASQCEVLLVDPPRGGLDTSVLSMTRKCPSIRHVLYVSCGRVALERDLEVLTKTTTTTKEGCDGGGGGNGAAFRVVDVAVLDLFPGTDAVETLVHLERVVGVDRRNERMDVV